MHYVWFFFPPDHFCLVCQLYDPYGCLISLLTFYCFILAVWTQTRLSNLHGTWSLWKLRTQHGDFIKKQCEVPVWPDWGTVVQAHCNILSSQGNPEQSASRTVDHPSLLHPGRKKSQIHFRHTQPRLRGRATFLLTAATLEWITKPIGAPQRGARWLLPSKWRHLLVFVWLKRIIFLDLSKLLSLVLIQSSDHVDLFFPPL